jgi:lipopolysaccharide heptosyltransferase II
MGLAKRMYSKVRQFSRTFEEYVTLVSSFLVSSMLYRRKDLSFADIRRIVVIRLDHIGDVILSIPAVANLRVHFPRARIAMVVSSSSEPIARYIPHVDEILCYDARFFDRSGSTRMFDFARGVRFAREMGRRKFDLIVDLRGSFASLFLALIAKSKYRIDRGTYLVQRKLRRIPLASEHEAEVNLNILARGGVPTLSREMSLHLTRADLDSVDALLRGCPTLVRKCTEPDSHSPIVAQFTAHPLVVIHPGASAPVKRWPAQRYARLARQLSQEYDARIVLVGGRGEERIARSVVSAMRGQVIDLSGQTTLGQLAAILRKADLFIGNDSGPMHLAAACGTKVIGLFGPTSPQLFGPYGDNCAALRMERDCPPCMRDECNLSGYRCIDRISVDDVIEVVRQMMPPD